jgi:4-hydroxybutyrate dehydrogenase
MIDNMAEHIAQFDFDRIIAFGGGTIIDICKILALSQPGKTEDIFNGQTLPKKAKALLAIPTTCGTGSEVTNISVAKLKGANRKKGVALDELFPDAAILIPEPLEGLPYELFMTSSMDALIHAVESYLSPKASTFTEMYSTRAMDIIMKGYREVSIRGRAEISKWVKDFLIASCYAGIAIVNAGCGAVHALSYSIGSEFLVPHGEANYQFFTEVLKRYTTKKPDGKIRDVTGLFADYIGATPDDGVIPELEIFFDKLIRRKPLREYGMVEGQIETFTDSTINDQQRLLANNYARLEREEIKGIFNDLFY